jgi:hypothetical protein
MEGARSRARSRSPARHRSRSSSRTRVASDSVSSAPVSPSTPPPSTPPPPAEQPLAHDANPWSYATPEEKAEAADFLSLLRARRPPASFVNTNFVDDGTLTFFWRPHTRACVHMETHGRLTSEIAIVLVLVLLAGWLIYQSMRVDQSLTDQPDFGRSVSPASEPAVLTADAAVRSSMCSSSTRWSR